MQLNDRQCLDLSRHNGSRWAAIIHELNALAALALEPERAASIIVIEDQILGRGYCTRLPYDTARQEYSSVDSTEKRSGMARPLHAEVMALADMLRSAKVPKSFMECEVYTNLMPCAACAQALVFLGVRCVYYINDFDNNLGLLILEASGASCLRFGSTGLRIP